MRIPAGSRELVFSMNISDIRDMLRHTPEFVDVLYKLISWLGSEDICECPFALDISGLVFAY